MSSPESNQRLLTYVDALREAVAQEMQRDPSVFVFGLDVDDHKAIQGSTRGLVDVFRRWTYACIGAEIARLTRYADRVIQLDPLAGDNGLLRDAVGTPGGAGELRPGSRTVFLLNGNLNTSLDIQKLFEETRERMARADRVVVVLYNSYFAWLLLDTGWLVRLPASSTPLAVGPDTRVDGAYYPALRLDGLTPVAIDTTVEQNALVVSRSPAGADRWNAGGHSTAANRPGRPRK